MPTKKQKLELTWIGKDQRPNLEPRILVEDPDKSYGDPNAENMLIHGDNLLALKALEQEFAGKVKCIFIDPPYNTGSVFEHYDDGVEHSLWLSLMQDRLALLRRLLCKEGSLWMLFPTMPYCSICDSPRSPNGSNATKLHRNETRI
jgi:adenine-specific DNA-methyltransferase